MINCFEYEPGIIDIIVPKYNIFEKVCVSDDKTLMLIIAVIRVTIIYGILYYLHKYVITNKQNILFMTLFIWLCINILFIFIIMFKNPLYDSKTYAQGMQELAVSLHKIAMEQTST